MGLIDNTNNNYKKYLTHSNKQQAKSIKAKKETIEKEISKCETQYDETVSNFIKNVRNNNNIVSLHCNINDTKQIIENELVQIKTTKYNDKFIKKLASVKFSHQKMIQIHIQFVNLIQNIQN